MKFVPVIVTGVSPEPTVAEVTERVEMLGVLDVEPDPPPPLQAAANSRITRRNTLATAENRCCICLPNTLPSPRMHSRRSRLVFSKSY